MVEISISNLNWLAILLGPTTSEIFCFKTTKTTKSRSKSYQLLLGGRTYSINSSNTFSATNAGEIAIDFCSLMGF